jgi:hypothetical protein
LFSCLFLKDPQNKIHRENKPNLSRSVLNIDWDSVLNIGGLFHTRLSLIHWVEYLAPRLTRECASLSMANATPCHALSHSDCRLDLDRFEAGKWTLSDDYVVMT